MSMMAYRRSPYWRPSRTFGQKRVVGKRTYKRKRFVVGRDRTIGNYLRYGGPGVKRPEQKFLDNDLSDPVISNSAAGVIASLNILPQGIAANERIGRKVTITKIKIRYRLSLATQQNASTLAASDTVRVMIFIDKQANGATAVGSDILRDSTDYHSFRLLSNVGRFVILQDSYVVMDFKSTGYDTVNTQFNQAGGQMYIRFNKTVSLPIEFSGVTGAITEIQSNNIGMLLISSNGLTGMNGKSRIRYTDC